MSTGTSDTSGTPLVYTTGPAELGQGDGRVCGRSDREPTYVRYKTQTKPVGSRSPGTLRRFEELECRSFPVLVKESFLVLS